LTGFIKPNHRTPNTCHYGGLGIGLTIAKGPVEAQGGKIWAESDGEGIGSTFTVLLPKEYDEADILSASSF